MADFFADKLKNALPAAPLLSRIPPLPGVVRQVSRIGQVSAGGLVSGDRWQVSHVTAVESVGHLGLSTNLLKSIGN